MRRLTHAVLVVALTLFCIAPARSDALDPKKALESLFRDQTIDADRFAPAFLSKVSIGDVRQIIASIKQGSGALTGIEPSGDGYSLRFERAQVPARIALDSEGRIAGLWLGPPTPAGTIGTHVAAIGALPGRTSLLVVTDGKPAAAHEAATPLAVGSAAKLAILLALKRAVAEGRVHWADVVKLDPSWKSLPSGQLQDWPDGTPLTIATLANMMVSLSDNTATDGLIHLVGRDAVEAISPRNTPFLTTRELFVLKGEGNAGLREEWRAGDVAARRALLQRIADMPLPAVDAISSTVTNDIEWFMTAEELCGLLDATADLPSLGINPGPVNRARWKSVAYKGGSEPGVLNLSSRLVGDDGRVHCVVATWNNDQPLHEEQLLAPYRGLAESLGQEH